MPPKAQIAANLKSLIQIHIDAGADLQDLVIVLHPQTALHLAQLLTAGNVRAFPNLGVKGGEIWGIQCLTSVGAICSGSPSEKVVACVNPMGVLVADDGAIEVRVTDKGSIQVDDAPTQDSAAGTGSTVTSLSQAESVAIGFTRGLNFSRSPTDSVSYMRVSY